MRLFKPLALGTLITLAALALNHCYFAPAAQVERAVRQAIRAVEREDTEGAVAFLDDQFADSVGLGREAWRRLMVATSAKWKDIRIRLYKVEVTVHGDDATLKCHALADATLASSMGPGKIPDRETAGRQNLELRLHRDRHGWRLRGVGDLEMGSWL
jgi:hypothetical protein